MVIRRVLGSSYKFQSRKEKQMKYGQTKNYIPPLSRCNEILSEVPQMKKIRTYVNKEEVCLGKRVHKEVVAAESN